MADCCKQVATTFILPNAHQFNTLGAFGNLD